MSDFVITKREILFSTIIISLMVGLGVWLSNPILQKASEKALRTVSSVTVSDNEKFGYIQRTNAGDFLAEGTLESIDPVSLPEIDGTYMKIEKVKEKYTRHVRHYTTTDGKGHTHHHTQVYWSWDVVHRDHFKSDSVTFLGQRFRLDSINYFIPLAYKETQPGGFHIRYKYYTHPQSVDGLMSGVCDNKTYTDLDFSKGGTIEKKMASAEKKLKASPIIFWILWLILTAGLLVLFYYFENNWLEDNNKQHKNTRK